MQKSKRQVFLYMLAIFFVGMSGASQAQSLNYPYCTAKDFSDRCTLNNLPNDATCDPVKAVAASDCAAYVDSIPGQINKFYHEAVDQTYAALASGIAVGLGLLAAFFKSQVVKLRKRLFDPFFQRKTRYESIGLNVLVVGAGGTGKTGIIRSISGLDDANPKIKSTRNRLYSVAHEVTMKKGDEEEIKRRLLRLFFNDIVGQDFGTIQESTFYKEPELQKLAKCVIFVVDIFDQEPHGQDMKFLNPDDTRISDQHIVFNRETIRQITKPLGSDGTVVLFINKIDKLQVVSDEVIAQVKEKFKDLIERLKKEVAAELFVIAGSAKHGTRIVGFDVDGDGALPDITLYGVLLGAAKAADF